MKKRLLSVLLALCMALALLPIALAADLFPANGQVDLKPASEIRYIDRVNLPDYALNFYKTLEEAADGNGYNDYLIDDEYLDLSGEDISSNEPGDFIRGNMTFSTSGVKTRYTAIVVTSMGETAATDENKANVRACIRAAYAAFCRDHPEVFWLNGISNLWCRRNGRMYYYYVLSQKLETETSAWKVRKPVFQPDGSLNLREIIAKRDADVKKILSTIPDGADRFTQVYYFNKWLTENNEYNTIVYSQLASGSINRPWDSTLCISALAGQAGAAGPECGGYAQAFQVLCNALGIPCVHVRYDHKNTVQSNGLPGGSHSWNYVQMEDGKWYAADVTWNDPSVNAKSGGVGKLSGHEHTNYLLVGGKTVISGKEFLVRHPAENPYPFKEKDSTIYFYFPNGPVLSDGAYPRKLHLSYMGMPERLAPGDSVAMMPVLLCGSDTDYTYSSTALPAGLMLNPNTGEIAGTVTDAADALTVTVTATNSVDPADTAQCTLQFPTEAMYTITFDSNSGKYTVFSASSKAMDVYLVAALYESSGKLREMKMVPLTLGEGESRGTLDFPVDSVSSDSVKVFLLDQSYAPLCTARDFPVPAVG